MTLQRLHQTALDLCILAYQTYHQSLVWPLDAWYESLARMGTDRRTEFLSTIRESFYEAARDVEGPWAGLLGPTWGDTLLDPVLTRPRQFNPKVPAFTVNPNGDVVVLRAPTYITDRITRTRVARYDATGKVTIDDVDTHQFSGDELIAFVGMTGHTGRPEVTVASLMGVVLRREVRPGVFDLFIVFRGSRSGSAVRAAIQGVLEAKGNADWVTDTANKNQAVFEKISRRGKVGVGFAKACESCLPTIEAAVKALGEGRTIRRIIVTGHSLGGGLAGHFVSAVSIGSYGVGLRERLGALPWDSIKGIAMAMPTLGDAEHRAAFDMAQACGEFSLCNIWVEGDAIVEAVDKLGEGRLGFWSPGTRVKLPLMNMSTKHANTNPHEVVQIRASLMARTEGDSVYAGDYATLTAGPRLQWGYYKNWASVLANAPSSYTSHVALEDTKIIRDAGELRAMLRLYDIKQSTEMYLGCLQRHFRTRASGASRLVGHAEATLLVMLGTLLGRVVDFNDDILTPLEVIVADPRDEATILAILRNEVDGAVMDKIITLGIILGGDPTSPKSVALASVRAPAVLMTGAALLAVAMPALIIGGAVKGGSYALANKQKTEVQVLTEKMKTDRKIAACDFYMNVRQFLQTHAVSFRGPLPEGEYATSLGRHRSTADIEENLRKLRDALMTARGPKRGSPYTDGWESMLEGQLMEVETHKAKLRETKLAK